MKKQIIRNILKVFAVGGTALLMASGAGLFTYLSCWLFFRIPHYIGYGAVIGFIVALIALICALGIVYLSGCWIVRKGKFER